MTNEVFNKLFDKAQKETKLLNLAYAQGYIDGYYDGFDGYTNTSSHEYKNEKLLFKYQQGYKDGLHDGILDS